MNNTVIGKKYQPGDKVECNGNPDGTVIRYYSTAMVEVRLWDGSRHVGDVCVPECDIKPHVDKDVTIPRMDL